MLFSKKKKTNDKVNTEKVDAQVLEPDSKKKPNKFGGLTIPRTVQESIPYESISKNGIMEIKPGVYSKSYKFDDVNFTTANEEDQLKIFEKFMNLLNTFDTSVRLMLTIYDRHVTADYAMRNVMLEPRMDGLNELREEYNNILKDKMREGKNNIIKEKYFTATLKAETADLAYEKFAKVDTDIDFALRQINGQTTLAMTGEERLDVLSSIYSGIDSTPLQDEMKFEGKTYYKYDFDRLKEQHVTTKDLIGPASLEFNTDHIVIDDDKYARTLYIRSFPSFINTNILPEITDLNMEMLFSIHYNKMAPDKAANAINRWSINIDANVIEAQRKAYNAHYDPSYISPKLKKAQEEAEALMTDISKRNQSLILTTFAITIFADSLEMLDKNCEMVKSVAAKYICDVDALKFQQEAAFNSSLPIGRCDIFTDRLLTTESIAVFMPFSTQELNQKNGIYYGLNAVSKNMILWNRKAGTNYNACIFGVPGSGKSFSAKREIVNAVLSTDDYVYVIDPEQEYVGLAEMLGGTVVKIKTGGDVYINPFDMDLDYGRDDDGSTNPIAMKVDYIAGLFEAMMGDGGGRLTSAELSIIDRCVTEVYGDYMQKMREIQEQHPEITADSNYAPTLSDLYHLLLTQTEYEAQHLALAAQRYAVGNLDTFARRTNINTQGRFVVYDISGMGDSMKELGLKVCLDAIWNRTIANFKKGKFTWFYADEAHLLIRSKSSASYLNNIVKRARKWQGAPCLITQNVSDFLMSVEASNIIANSNFVMMLNQSPQDRFQLAELLNISPTQLGYVTNAEPGSGLLYNGKTTIPFIDRFPTDTQLYKVMTTKAGERLR